MIKLKFHRIIISIFLLVVANSSIGFAQEDLVLTIIPDKEIYAVGEPIKIKALFTSKSGHILWGGILSKMVAEDIKFYVPPAVLKFEIIDNKGKKRPLTSTIFYELAVPSIADFVSIGRGYIYGREVDITRREFEYDVKDEGTYMIKAVYECKTKEWMDFQIKKGIFKNEKINFYFPFEAIFSGRVESNEIKIKIIGSKQNTKLDPTGL